MKILKAFFWVSVLLLSSLTSLAYADPQASATTTLNFTLTFKNASGDVLASNNYLNTTDWGLDLWHYKWGFDGTLVPSYPVDTYENGVLINGLDESRTASQGTASGQSGVTGSLTDESAAVGMSNHAEVDGGLLNAKHESMTALSSIYNLTFGPSNTEEGIYLYIAVQISQRI